MFFIQVCGNILELFFIAFVFLYLLFQDENIMNSMQLFENVI